MTPTPTEMRRREAAYDAQLDCSAAELEGRRRQRESDRAWRESVRRYHRRLDLSPASRIKLDEWQARRDDAEREAIERAILLKNPLAVTADDLDLLPVRDRLQLETKIMIARHKEQTNVVNFPGPNNAAPPPFIQSAATLRTKNFAPVRYIVPGYLAEGCTILAGRPKVGKSWLMLDVGLAVAAGSEVLGTKPDEGDVLYLGLEDNERRLRSRIQKILGPFAEWPRRFGYATTWCRQHEGGLDQIRAWIESVSLPRLVVVDVLARFRTPQNGQNGQYEADYQAVQGLQAIASEKNVAIVIVHHLRKSAADADPFDKVSGTLGLSGAADSVLILDRDGQGTTLYGRGRDIEEIETAITFDRGRCRWQVLGAAADVRLSDERKVIIDALRASGAPMSRSEIAAATGMAPNNVDQMLWKMTRSGEITKAARGVYQLVVLPNVRILPPPPY